MNEKQRKFCREFIAGKDAPTAAAAAGYTDPARTAMRLMQRPDIQSAINKGAPDDKRIAVHDEILAFFSSVMRGEATDTLTVQNKRKRQYTDKNGDRVTDEETVIETFSVPVRLADSMNAANTLHKYYTSTAAAPDAGETGVVILPEVKTGGRKK